MATSDTIRVYFYYSNKLFDQLNYINDNSINLLIKIAYDGNVARRHITRDRFCDCAAPQFSCATYIVGEGTLLFFIYCLYIYSVFVNIIIII